MKYNRGPLGYYQFSSLGDQAVLHAVFTRQGGFSAPPFDSLNIGAAVGDDTATVQANLQQLYAVFDIAAGRVVSPRQVHGRRVVAVNSKDGGTIPECDGLVSNEPGLALLMRFADCVPVLLYDPVQRAIGLAHAGWRGTLKRVVAATVESMVTAYGTRPGDIRAVVGPSIGPCCLEIGPEVVASVQEALPDAATVLSRFAADGHAYLDLWLANHNQLAHSGVQHIESAEYCTCCNQNTFFSHRGSKGKTGRFGVIIGLR